MHEFNLVHVLIVVVVVILLIIFLSALCPSRHVSKSDLVVVDGMTNSMFELETRPATVNPPASSAPKIVSGKWQAEPDDRAYVMSDMPNTRRPTLELLKQDQTKTHILDRIDTSS